MKKAILFSLLFFPLSVSAADYWEKNGCVRGLPEPVIKKDAYKNTRFVLNREDGAALESAKIDEHTTLTITHSGCEYYGLKFQFMVDDPEMKFPVVGDEYRQAMAQLEKVEKNISSPFHLDQVRGIMQTYLNLVSEPKLGESLNVTNDLISTTTWVEMQQNDQATTFEISVSMGPL